MMILLLFTAFHFSDELHLKKGVGVFFSFVLQEWKKKMTNAQTTCEV